MYAVYIWLWPTLGIPVLRGGGNGVNWMGKQLNGSVGCATRGDNLH